MQSRFQQLIAKLQQDPASVFYDAVTVKDEEQKMKYQTPKTILNMLIKDPWFLEEEKTAAIFENTMLKKHVCEAIDKALQDKSITEELAKSPTALKFTELLSVYRLGNVADALHLSSLQGIDLDKRRDFLQTANYFNFKSVRGGDILSCTMLGWYFWEKRHLAIAKMLFDISLSDGAAITNNNDQENIAHVGACLVRIESVKCTGNFDREMKYLRAYFEKSTVEVTRWHNHISHWILKLGNMFRTGNNTERLSNPAKARMCYELALLYNRFSLAAIKRFKEIGLFSKVVSSPLLSSVTAGATLVEEKKTVREEPVSPSGSTPPVVEPVAVPITVRSPLVNLSALTVGDKRLERLAADDKPHKRSRGLDFRSE